MSMLKYLETVEFQNIREAKGNNSSLGYDFIQQFHYGISQMKGNLNPQEVVCDQRRDTIVKVHPPSKTAQFV